MLWSSRAIAGRFTAIAGRFAAIQSLELAGKPPKSIFAYSNQSGSSQGTLVNYSCIAFNKRGWEATGRE